MRDRKAMRSLTFEPGVGSAHQKGGVARGEREGGREGRWLGDRGGVSGEVGRGGRGGWWGGWWGGMGGTYVSATALDVLGESRLRMSRGERLSLVSGAVKLSDVKWVKARMAERM